MNNNKNNIFFVLTMGRSGTQFLSSLLNNAPDTRVIHEFPLDLLFYQFAYKNEHLGMKYFEYLRNHSINRNVSQFINYGEVNSVLRRHLPAIKRFFPHAHLFHLVRDGRFVIRSIMSRKTMKWYDPVTKLVYPEKNSDFRDQWIDMNRFEKICWYWAEENNYISSFTEKMLFFEGILKDYNHLKHALLDPACIDISESQWQTETNKPKNITKHYSFPHPDNWTIDMKNTFNKICGRVMVKYHYPVF